MIGISSSKKLVLAATKFFAWEKGRKGLWNGKLLRKAELIDFMLIQFDEDIFKHTIRRLQSVLSTCGGRFILFTHMLIVGPCWKVRGITNNTMQGGGLRRRGLRRGTITDPFDMPFKALSLNKGKNLKTFWAPSLFLDVFEFRESELGRRKQKMILRNLFHHHLTLTYRLLTKRTLFKGMLFSSK